MANSIVRICIFLAFLAPSSSVKEPELKDDDEINMGVYKKYIDLDRQMQSLVKSASKQVLPAIVEANEHLNISASCTRNLFTLIRGAMKLKLWAVRFLDSSGKPSDGLLNGNINFLGDYNQCLAARVRKADSNIDFRGKYCLLQFSPILPEPKSPISIGSGLENFVNAMKNSSEVFRYMAENANQLFFHSSNFGLCVPSGCKKTDVEQMIKYFGKNFMINAKVLSCQEEGWNNVLNTRNIVIICIFCFFGLLGILGAITDYCVKEKEEKSKSFLEKLLICFSFTSNFQKLMNTKSSSDSTISCLHGIRVLTVFYIILCHQFYWMGIFLVERHLTFFKPFVGRFSSQMVVNGFLSVEAFFFMSGLLHSYVRTSKERDHEKSSYSYTKMILFRIWRLAPSYIFSVLTMFLLVAKGPLAVKYQMEYVDNCENNWWWNLLFINNFLKEHDVCFMQSWYVSADMQLFLISMFVVSLLIRKPRKGIVVSIMLLISGLILTIVWSWINRASPSVDYYRPEREQMEIFGLVYTSPFPHIAPYVTGLLMGYFLAVRKEIKLPMFFQIVGWPTAFICFTTILFASKRWNSGTEYTLLESCLYFSLGRFVYSLCIAWMVFCCATRHGGIINYVLSMKLWVPLSRISYAVYLISPSLQAFYYVNRRYSTDMHEMVMIWQHFGDVVVSCLLGMFIVLLAESPSIAFQNLIFVRRPEQESKKENEGNQNGSFKNDSINNKTPNTKVIFDNGINISKTIDATRL